MNRIGVVMNRSRLIRVLLFCFCIFVQGAAATIDDGLVAYYPFNGNANDESGNGHDGTVTGATLAEDRFGNADSAYYFDGIDDRIDLPDEVLNFERTDAYSKSFWIKTTDGDLRNNIIAKMTASLDARGINVVLANGVLRVQLINHNTGANRIRVDGTTVLSDDQWHHVVVTYDGLSSAAGVRLYVDGHPEIVTVVHDTLTDTILNSQTPTIGSRNTAYDYYYQGTIDDVRIYNRVLTEQQVQELYTDDGSLSAPELEIYSDVLTNTLVVAGDVVSRTMTLANTGDADLEFSFCPPPVAEDSSLLLHYTFDADSGTTVIDQSGNGNDGTLKKLLYVYQWSRRCRS